MVWLAAEAGEVGRLAEQPRVADGSKTTNNERLESRQRQMADGRAGERE